MHEHDLQKGPISFLNATSGAIFFKADELASFAFYECMEFFRRGFIILFKSCKLIVVLFGSPGRGANPHPGLTKWFVLASKPSLIGISYHQRASQYLISSTSSMSGVPGSKLVIFLTFPTPTSCNWALAA